MNEKIKTGLFINGLLVVILVLLIGNYASTHMSSAQAAGAAWNDGIMIGAAGIQERLVLVDLTKQNIMIYHSRQGGGFGLSGVRSYKYDVEALDGKIPNNGWTYFEAEGYYDAAHK